MLKLKEISLDDNMDKTKHLYAVGSILNMGAQNATIWGSGMLEEPRKAIILLFKFFRKLDIRLVRGPKTREWLLKMGYKCPELYGDPALIMPMIYKPKKSKKTNNKIVVIKHFSDEKKLEKNKKFIYLDPIVNINHYEDIIDDIASAKLVISSSLHGIIIAEAYGVPAILMKGSQTDNKFKYDDYYYSTGRFNYDIADNENDALELLKNYKKVDLSKLQKNIIDSFPYDVFVK